MFVACYSQGLLAMDDSSLTDSDSMDIASEVDYLDVSSPLTPCMRPAKAARTDADMIIDFDCTQSLIDCTDNSPDMDGCDEQQENESCNTSMSFLTSDFQRYCYISHTPDLANRLLGDSTLTSDKIVDSKVSMLLDQSHHVPKGLSPLRYAVVKGRKIQQVDLDKAQVAIENYGRSMPDSACLKPIVGLLKNVQVSLDNSPHKDKRINTKKRPLSPSVSNPEVIQNYTSLGVVRDAKSDHTKKRRVDIMKRAVEVFGSPIRLKCQLVDTQHCKHPDVVCHGALVKKVNGGHDLSSYQPFRHLVDSTCFVFDRNDAIAILLGNVIKTTARDYSHEKILQISQMSRVVAANDKLEIWYVDGLYYGAHRDQTNQVIVNTVFPIGVIFDPECTEGTMTRLGSFATLSPDLIPTIQDVPVEISKVDFDNLVARGDSISARPHFQDFDIVDISMPVCQDFSTIFAAQGMSAVPSMFALVKKL